MLTNNDEDVKLVKDIMEAYYDEKIRVILIKGFEDDDKLFDAIFAATRITQNPRVKIRTSHLHDTKAAVQRVVDKYLQQGKISFDTKNPFLFNGKEIYVDKWDDNKDVPVYGDVSIYYPVKTVIAAGGEENLDKFKTAISKDNSRLIILLTKHDVRQNYLDFSLLDDIVDKSFVLDSSKKYPDTYSTILNNLKVDKIHYE